MVLTVVALAAVALVIADSAGMILLRSRLIERVDSQLSAQSRGFSSQPGGHIPEDLDRQLDRQEERRSPSFGPNSRFYRYDADGQRVTAPTPAASTTDAPTGDHLQAQQPTPEADASSGEEPDLSALGDIRDHADDSDPSTVDGIDGSSWRVRVTRLPDDRGYIVSAVSLAEVEQTSETLLLINVAVTGLVLLMMGAAAATIVRMGLRPLTRMQTTAETIAAGDLSRRVEDADQHTEPGRLGLALNTMLGRIEAAVAEQAASERRLRQVLADAAHELRTPLTSIQGFAELYRRGGAPPGPVLDEAMGRIESEVSRMRLLVNDMLLLARLDEERPLRCQPVDLLSVAADAVRDAHVRVPARFVRLAGIDDRRDTFEPVTAIADEARIRQVITNLIANALQHTPDDAQIVVKVGRPLAVGDLVAPTTVIGADLTPGRRVAAIEVVDTGPGMTYENAQRVFERLYRADPSRSRRHGGAGLGLAIVASIVTSHGGRVELWTASGAGARFRVLLPAQPPSVEGEDEDEDKDELACDEPIGPKERPEASPRPTDHGLDRRILETPGLQGGSEEA